jgi:hypothetical protein
MNCAMSLKNSTSNSGIGDGNCDARCQITHLRTDALPDRLQPKRSDHLLTRANRAGYAHA